MNCSEWDEQDGFLLVGLIILSILFACTVYFRGIVFALQLFGAATAISTVTVLTIYSLGIILIRLCRKFHNKKEPNR